MSDDNKFPPFDGPFDQVDGYPIEYTLNHSPLARQMYELFTLVRAKEDKKYLHMYLSGRNEFLALHSDLGQEDFTNHFNLCKQSTQGCENDYYVMTFELSGQFGDELRKSGIDFSAYPTFDTLRQHLQDQETVKWLLKQQSPEPDMKPDEMVEHGHPPAMAHLKPNSTRGKKFIERCASANISTIYNGGQIYSRSPMGHFNYKAELIANAGKFVESAKYTDHGIPKYLEKYEQAFEQCKNAGFKIFVVFFNPKKPDFQENKDLFCEAYGDAHHATNAIRNKQQNTDYRAILVLDTQRPFVEQLKNDHGPYVSRTIAVEYPIISPDTVNADEIVPHSGPLSWLNRPEPGEWR